MIGSGQPRSSQTGASSRQVHSPRASGFVQWSCTSNCRTTIWTWDSRDVVKLVMGLIATMAALVLSLLIASANSSYDRQSSELKALSTNILLLDRTLKFYGTGAKEVRDGLQDAIVQTHDRIWSREGVRPENLELQGNTKLRER